jgi:hypothetical protein
MSGGPKAGQKHLKVVRRLCGFVQACPKKYALKISTSECKNIISKRLALIFFPQYRSI